MRRAFLYAVSAGLLVAAAHAQTTPMLDALRQQHWVLAQRLAAADPDPVAGKVVTFIRLLKEGQARAAELAAFLAANPGWPDQDTLERRYGEALAAEADAHTVLTACETHAPSAAAGLLRCADAWSLAGQPARATQAARQGWATLAGDADAEAEALARWGPVLTQADQQDRFDRLEASDAGSAARQAARLDPPARAAALARIALRRRAPDALALVASVPPPLRSDPRLLVAQLRYLRRSGDTQSALALWRATASAAEVAAPPGHRLPFWTERDALARAALGAGDAKTAYVLADDRLLAADQAQDARFLAGWIALRRLNDATAARAQFQALADGAHAAITRARAAYWLAQTETGPARAAALAQAAAWPSTYYGQLAARASASGDAGLQTALMALHDPPVVPAEVQQWRGDELARAAGLLVGWDDPRRAADFLRVLAQRGGSPGARAALAQLALRLGVPDAAVLEARLAGRDGVVLGASGWPVSVTVPPSAAPPGPAAPALVLAVMRQESSFDPAATSVAGARGLMQLMPATAAQVAHSLGTAAGPLDDPALNTTLGAGYLGGLLAQFGGHETLAIAAYNAGPHRVRDWMATTQGALADPDGTVDWIELIPFAETRNYVQRVLENEAIYRARPARPVRDTE